MRLETVCLLLGAGLLIAGPARADRWDNTSTQDDTASTTLNELHHGVVQEHDVNGSQDQDWYRMASSGRSSYEVLLDGFSFQATPYFDFERFASSDTSTPLDYFVAVGAGYQLSLRWENTDSTASDDRIKVAVDTTGTYSTSDGYFIKAYETSLAVPRYNNTGGQVTVLLCQNPADYTIDGNVYLWNASGGLVTSFTYSLGAMDLLAQNLATVNAGAADNTAGSLTVSQDGRFGDLVCKSVALDPATGFSFDSPGVYRPL